MPCNAKSYAHWPHDVASWMGRAILGEVNATGLFLMLGCRRVSCLVGIHGKKTIRKNDLMCVIHI